MANNNDKFISRENAKTLWGYMIDLLTGKQNKLTFDDTPTQSSDNPVKSGGIFTALAGKGTYSKPQNGIPKSDLASAVQTSLEKADSALQSYTETDPTVPSWAKQTNKPAYTQDEVGDGTTYKRVSSTEKDTWNAKGTYSKPSGGIPKSDLASAVQTSLEKADSALQSYTETDPTVPSWAKQSSKPSYNSDEISDTNRTHKFATQAQLNQISTNQTNILYATNKVGKNELKLTGDVSNPNTVRVYWNYEEGTVRITGTLATTSTVFISLGSWTAKKTGEYVLASEGANSTNIYVYDDGSWNTNGSPIATWTAGTTRYLYVRIASGVVVGDVTVKPMVCLKTLYDEDSSVDAYALPNYDLTRLESEDRASLAEVVDSGAKNRFIYDEWKGCTVSAGTGVFENNGVSLTSSGNDCFTVYTSSEFPTGARITGKTGETIVISWDYEVADNVEGQLYIFPNATTTGMVFGNIRDKKLEYTFTSGISYITFRCGVRGNGNVAKYKNIMCSTKAAFGVSHKFVPYRPNWDLVVTHMATVCESQVVNSGSLDDVTTSKTAYYSNNVSGMPSGVNGYAICETIVFDANVAVQKLYMIDGVYNAFVRMKQTGTWRAWKQITNV